MTEISRLRAALRYYAEGQHFVRSDECAWDTVSGEPCNFWCDEAGTATVEDGTIARMALDGMGFECGEEDDEITRLREMLVECRRYVREEARYMFFCGQGEQNIMQILCDDIDAALAPTVELIEDNQ